MLPRLFRYFNTKVFLNIFCLSLILAVCISPWIYMYYLVSTLIYFGYNACNLYEESIYPTLMLINYGIFPIIVAFDVVVFYKVMFIPYTCLNILFLFLTLDKLVPIEEPRQPCVIDCSRYYIDYTSEEVCPICLEDNVNAKLDCGHYLHATYNCLHWSITNNMCSLCRQSIY